MSAQRRQFVLAFLAYLIQRDVDPQAIHATSGISPDMLAKPDTVVSDVQLHRLWNAAVELTGDDLFGLHLGESFQLAAMGAVGEIIKTSKTVGEALTIAATLTPVISTAVSMEVKKTSDVVSVCFTQTRPDTDPAIKQIVDFFMGFTIHELNGFLLKKISPKAVIYPFRAASPDEYNRLFYLVPVIKEGVVQIDFDGGVWDVPIITADFERQRKLLEKIANEGDHHSASFQAKIMGYLLKNSFRGILSLEDVAANFNITPRSLQRRLQDDGTTFQQIADSVRKTLALHYLETGNYKMKEISTLLGYNEVSAFSRAFKRWTGKAPVEYNL